MVTLTQESAFFKRLTVFGVFALIVAILILLFGRTIKNIILPPKPNPATVAFGKLPPLDLSRGIPAHDNITYKVDTISGELPNLARVAKVFAVAIPSPSFEAGEKAKSQAAKIGFLSEAQEILPGTLQFVDRSDPNRVLTIETLTGYFDLTDTTDSGSAPSVEEAIKLARDFFGKFDLDMAEFSQVKTSQREDDLVVDFWRGDFDELPAITISEDQSLVWAVVSKKGVVEAKMNASKVKRFKFATYPLKGVEAAFGDLEKGSAVFNTELDGSEFVIKNVTLAYLENEKQQRFLQPVYLFMGDSGKEAYVPAVSDDWVDYDSASQ